jgi:type IV pilus assembly protein PilY1
VNVFNRAQTLDNLYIALFEAQSTLRWPGNLKKLKLNDSDADGVFDSVVDANGDPGFESTGDDIGRITFDAVTFWTDPSELPIVPDLPDGVDGRTVDRGGAGQKINGFIEGGTDVIGETNATTNARQVYVEPASITNGSANAFDAFDGDATMAAALADDLLGLGGATPTATNLTDAEELIKWGRGLDVDDDDGDGNVDDPRSWILADAIHSRPLAINYGITGSYSPTNPNIRIFMGTNDGQFHIFENTTAGTAESGEEIFTFYPRDVLGNIALHRDNIESSAKMRYGVDGPAVALVVDNDGDGNIEAADSDEVYVYFGMRRGGFSYYALDVSNPSATPTLKWKITQTSDGDFDELGLTFSRPLVGKVKFGATSTDVLIFAGGYNGGWDSSYTSRVGKDAGDTDDSVGNAVYIVNARTGQLIWKAYWDGTSATGSEANSSAETGFSYQHAEMVDSIPSSVTAMENLSGNIHRLYVGDTGGAVWRVDLPQLISVADVETKWFITKFAELGTDGATTDRRFFHAPDIVETFDSTGNYDGVLLNTGDRANPTETSVSNYLFYLKDRLVISGDPAIKVRELDPLVGPMVLVDIPDQTTCLTGVEIGCNASLLNGWRIELEGSGEKALSSPLTDSGRVFFTSFEPSTGTSVCDLKEGEGFVYLVNLSDGTAIYNDKRKYDIGPGIPPGAITLGDSIFLPGGGADFGDIDGDGIPEPRTKLPPSLGKNLWLMYWRELGIDEL